MFMKAPFRLMFFNAAAGAAAQVPGGYPVDFPGAVEFPSGAGDVPMPVFTCAMLRLRKIGAIQRLRKPEPWPSSNP
jgi:hypothetical protein